MARRRRTVYRYRSPKRRYRRGGGGGGFKPIIDGFIAGIGGQIASKWLGPWGHPAATLGVGMWRKNPTLKTEGARELGIALGASIPIIGGAGSQGTAGGFE